jgi:hypothetical protein
MAKWQVLLDMVFVSAMNRSRAAEAAPAPGRLGLAEVAPSRARAQHLATGGDFEPLGSGFLRFNAFWTSHNSRISQFLQKERRI